MAVKFQSITSVAQYAVGLGIGASQFKACLAECHRKATAGSTTFSTWQSWSAQPAYSTANFSGYRVVTFGVHLFTISSPETSDGVVGAMENMGAPPDSILALSTLVPVAYRDTRYNADFTWRSRAEGPEANIYKDITSTDPAGWSSLTAFGSLMTAVDSGNFMLAEVTMNCEVHALEGTSYANLMAESKSENSDLTAIAANASKKVPSVMGGAPEVMTSAVQSSVMDEVGRFVAFAAPYAVDMLIAAL